MQALLNDIRAYVPEPDEDQDCKSRFLSLLSDCQERAFYRDFFDPGHITGSALLISGDGSRILMNHHKFLDKWLCFGGHADGDQDTLNVALRECIEETAISDIVPVSLQPLDFDIHPIPANPKKGEPPHGHFDVRYMFRCRSDEAFKASAESINLRWCSHDEAMSLASDASMRRLIRKAGAALSCNERKSA